MQNLSIAILAGGQSRRMGQDKALLELGGQALIDRVAERVRPLSDDLFTVASARPEYERFGLRVVPDRFPDAGSLGGIYTAIAEARYQYCLVVACDMPFLNRELLRYMAGLERDFDVLVPSLTSTRSDQGGRETLETLHSIYSKECLPAIQARLESGRYKIIGFFDDVRVKRLDEQEFRGLDPDLLSFFNANTPEEFAWASGQRDGDQS